MDQPRHTDNLSTSLDIPGDFSTQVSAGIPVEIVDAENQGVLSNEADRQNASPENMDVAVRTEQKLDSTRLSTVSEGTVNMLPIMSASLATTDELPNIENTVIGQPPIKTTSSVGIPASVTHLSTPSRVPSGGVNKALAIDSLSTCQALEISTDALPSLSRNLPISPSNPPTSVSVNRPREMISKFGIGLSPNAILTQHVSPTTTDDEFDSSDLLNQSLFQQDEVTQRLSQAGPIGVAAAAAILSSRKRKRAHSFETNPSFRKRHCSKLTKKLKETIEELSTRVGLQACIVIFRPGKPEIKSEPTFKVNGAAPLCNVLKELQGTIVAEMNATLHQQTPQTIHPKPLIGETLHELPPLIFDGIPTPVHKMTQAQLRTFIPVMLKASTGRGKPGWGKDAVKPTWWPAEVPWANVRSDVRNDEQKRSLAWTDALRRIVLSCYLHHGRIDLLPEFTLEQLQQLLSPEAAEHLQEQLESLQQQQQQQQQEERNSLLSDSLPVSNAHTVVGSGTDLASVSHQDMLGMTDSQQVFTVDTGMGNSDTSGMPTLADASLAETASRLQQVADETGEVQYATQTVTVTERDAKALGQPVGSTTTVLLTAYPGGHSGSTSNRAGGLGEGVIGTTQDTSGGQSFLSSQSSTSETGNPPNIQVVYSSPHVEPNSLVSSKQSSVSQSVPFGASASANVSSLSSSVDMSISASSDFLTAAASRELLEATSSMSTIPHQGEDSATDLAAELINQYTTGVTGNGASEFEMKHMKDDHLMGSTSAELVPVDGETEKT